MGNDCSCLGEISVAAWGSSTGEEWKYSARSGISQIIIRHGDVIDSVIFKDARSSHYSTKFGGNGGYRTDKVTIDFPAEFLTGISGTYLQNIHSLKIQTNQALYGPFGDPESSGNASSFTFHAKDGVITGFHGRAGRLLNAIGVFIMPACSVFTEIEKKKPQSALDSIDLRPCLPPPRSAGPWGGNDGRDWDDGVFSTVLAVDVRVRVDIDVVSAVRCSYKQDGLDSLSLLHGGHGSVGMERKTNNVFGESEFLIGVEGYFGPLEGNVGVNIIRSLTFVTNQAKYGPMGAEISTYFTTMNFVDCNRKVVGFHGRCGAYLDAVGVHTEYFNRNASSSSSPSASAT